jgi:hypothetical protein
MSDVILASVASVNKLFAAAGSAASLDQAASRISQQLCVGLGPLLDTWRMMPGHAQVGRRGGVGGKEICVVHRG